MDPISNSDRLVAILRQKLRERSKVGSKATLGKSGNDTAPSLRAARNNPLAPFEGSDERSLRRSFIQHLLSDQLGEQFVNDAQFQQVVTRVTDTIESDEMAAKLLTRVIADVRGAG